MQIATVRKALIALAPPIFAAAAAIWGPDNLWITAAVALAAAAGVYVVPNKPRPLPAEPTRLAGTVRAQDGVIHRPQPPP